MLLLLLLANTNTMSLALSDLTTTHTNILESTRRDDSADVSETIAVVYQILLLAYKSNEVPTLADILNAHGNYFSPTNNSLMQYSYASSSSISSTRRNEDTGDVNERTYQYILDLSLSSESDWYSKLAVESKPHGLQEQPDDSFDSYSTTAKNNDADELDTPAAPALLLWSAHCWLDTSFGNRHLLLPEQLSSFETKHQLEDFAASHRGLSQMQLRGRENDRAHWWKGGSTGGLSLYLSSTAALHQWELRRTFRRWERGAALFQFSRYRSLKLSTILRGACLRETFDEWSEWCTLETISELYFVRRHWVRWQKWIQDRALQEPFDAWVREIKQWKKRLIAFDYWCDLSFRRQLQVSFARWIKLSRSLTTSLSLHWTRYYFVRWSNATDHSWERRTYYQSAAKNTQKIRTLRIKIWVLNGWQTHVMRLRAYREGATTLAVLASKYAKRKMQDAVEAWYHVCMLEMHEEYFEYLQIQKEQQYFEQISLEDNVLLTEPGEETFAYKHQRQILGRCWKKWLKRSICTKNKQLIENIAMQHLRQKQLGAVFFHWNQCVVQKHQQQRKVQLAADCYSHRLYQRFFVGFILNLIAVRQAKIKVLEAAMHYTQHVVEKYFRQWRRWKMILYQ